MRIFDIFNKGQTAENHRGRTLGRDLLACLLDFCMDVAGFCTIFGMTIIEFMVALCCFMRTGSTTSFGVHDKEARHGSEEALSKQQTTHKSRHTHLGTVSLRMLV